MAKAIRPMIRQLCRNGTTVSMRIRGLLNAASVRIAPSSMVNGIPVVVLDSVVSVSEVTQKLATAFETLAAFDRRRYRIIRAHVKRVLVWPGHYDASDGLGGVLLSAERLRDAMLADTVGTLVHEATHLRIANFGVSYRSNRRERIERLCVDEQVLSLIQCGLVDLAVGDRLRESLHKSWWTAEAQADDRAELRRRLAAILLPWISKR